jgi:hypothetical protein
MTRTQFISTVTQSWKSLARPAIRGLNQGVEEMGARARSSKLKFKIMPPKSRTWKKRLEALEKSLCTKTQTEWSAIMKTNIRSRISLIAAAMLAAQLAMAATLTVTNTDDSGPGSMRTALANSMDGDTINASSVSGTISLTSGELLVSKSVIILGPGPATLAVAGNSSGHQHVFHISQGHNVAISGLTIAIGYASGSFPANAGGGIYNDNSMLTVSNCIVNGNTATYGGGIYNNGESGSATLTLINSDVSGNNQVTEGGGIYNDGEYGSATLTVINSTVSGNTTKYPSGYGGGIYNDAYEGSATVTVMNSTLNLNQAAQNGAGIYNYCEYGTATLTVSNSTMSANRTQFPYGYGGAIYNDGEYQGTAALKVINSTLSGNGVYKSGGAIYNYAYQGSAPIDVINSTLSGNQVGINGGGIYNDGESQGSASLRVFNSTLSTNTGGIYNYGSANANATVEIGSTILNGSGASPNITNVNGTVTSDGFNLSSDNGSGLLTATGDQTNTDPMLGPLQDNVGPAFTHALQAGSPAIDKGRNFSGLPTDQRGRPRPYDDPAIVNAAGGDGSDIGAFELGPASNPPTLTITHPGNEIVVSWPPSATGWTLQTNNNLVTGTWGNYLGPVPNNSATNSPPVGILFFRLKR